ncbi:hypothetical protein ACFL1D_02270 [Candidatus Omnitrophota bacterium]
MQLSTALFDRNNRAGGFGAGKGLPGGRSGKMLNEIKTLYLDVARLKVKLSTNYAKYYDYLRSYFEPVISSRDFTDDFDIEANAFWQKGQESSYLKELKRSGNFADVGANTLINEKKIVTIRKIEKKKKVIFDFKASERKLYLKAILRWKVFKDAIRYGIFGKSEEDWFFSVTFPVLYYPLFWYLEYFMQTHILHASGIELNGRGLVVCGMEGIGKTSLVLSLLQEPGAHFLSDNLLFYDSQRIYPCYELVRIHKNEDDSLWRDKFRRVDKFRSLKGFFKPAFALKKEGVAPKIIIFPQFSQKFSVKAISGLEVVHKAAIMSQLPAELGNYGEFRKLYNFLDLNFNPQQSEYKALGALLNSCRCYTVGMPKADGLKANVERLKDFLKE